MYQIGGGCSFLITSHYSYFSLFLFCAPRISEGGWWSKVNFSYFTLFIFVLYKFRGRTSTSAPLDHRMMFLICDSKMQRHIIMHASEWIMYYHTCQIQGWWCCTFPLYWILGTSLLWGPSGLWFFPMKKCNYVNYVKLSHRHHFFTVKYDHNII